MIKPLFRVMKSKLCLVLVPLCVRPADSQHTGQARACQTARRCRERATRTRAVSLRRGPTSICLASRSFWPVWQNVRRNQPRVESDGAREIWGGDLVSSSRHAYPGMLLTKLSLRSTGCGIAVTKYTGSHALVLWACDSRPKIARLDKFSSYV